MRRVDKAVRTQSAGKGGTMPYWIRRARMAVGVLATSMAVQGGCTLDTIRTYPTTSTTTTTTTPPTSPTLTQNAGTAISAPVKTGFVSASVLGAGLGAVNAISVDSPAAGATVTESGPQTLIVTAPDLPKNGTTDTFTIGQTFVASGSVLPSGYAFGSAVSALGAYVTLYHGLYTLNLQYSDFGFWTAGSAASSPSTEVGVFAIGNATPSANLPTTGSAVYTGIASGVYANSAGSGYFGGSASLSANFASNSISGSISDIRVTPSISGPVTGSMNAISLSGTISGGTYAGTATAASTAGTAAAITGAAGTFGGGFYGTSASETTGIFSLTGGASNAQLIGSFGAWQSYASANASSAVNTLASLANGTALTATVGSGLVTATYTQSSTGGTLAADTTNKSNASIVLYSNGAIDLNAPNIPYVGATSTSATLQTVSYAASSFQLASSATAASPVQGTTNLLLPFGTQEASATSIVAGSPPTASNQVTMYRMGAAVGLQYSDFGVWQTTAVTPAGAAAGTLKSSFGLYGTGVATPTSQMPTTGSALYTGTAYGVMQVTPTGGGQTYVSALTAPISLTANFAAATMTGSITPISYQLADGLTTAGTTVQTIALAGTITGAGFAGTATYNTATGTFGGGFYGPNAKEIAGTFTVGTAVGAFGAHK